MSKNNFICMPENHMDKLYNSKNPLVRYVHTNRLERISKLISCQTGQKILDAGCGEGHLIKRLHADNKNSLYCGIDRSEVALEKAMQRCPDAEFYNGDITRTHFSDNSFDFVICTEVLEHIFGYKTAIQELKRILKINGHLIITFPNETLWSFGRFLLGRRPIKVPDHVNSFIPRKISSLVGLKLLSLTTLPFGFPFFVSLGCIMEFEK